MSEPLLACEGLRGGYGGKPVLQGVDLAIAPGEIVAVIGRNGVGKTTLMRCLIGLLPAAAGAIRFKGEDISASPAHKRARLGLGYVPQGREVFSRMSVEDNLRVGLTAASDPPAEEFERVYKIFPILAERRRQRVGSMSGGQQQQLAIARVLVGKPSLVLLDEPSEGIQPSIVAEIGDVMRRLNEEMGLTVVLVEQNLDLIRAMARRCYVMDKGRIVATLAPDALEDIEIVRKHLAI